MEYYYTESTNISTETGELYLRGSEFDHVAKVLRKRTGDEITVTDGNGNIYMCVIFDIRAREALCKIQGHQSELFEPKTRVRLFMSPLKSRERFEFAVEKSVELGVDSIIPVITSNTVKRTDYSGPKSERIKKIIVRAMCQSQRCRLPAFYESVSFGELLENTNYDLNKIVMYEFSADQSPVDVNSNSQNISLLIGPEGGFDESEIEMLIKNGWKAKSLGKRKLRAETAAIVSVYDLLSKFQ
jgi:16S rRNA (uracil1498-N3)-methyltransferase